MSVVDMATAATARRPDFPPPNRVPRTHAEVAAAAETSVVTGENITAAIKLITSYIPIEVLTLYVAVLAALHDPSMAQYPEAGWSAFCGFLLGTPVVIWIVFATKVKGSGGALPVAPTRWPLWEMSAGTIAYLAWAFALPGTPFTHLPWYSSALAGVVVLAVSTFVGLVSPLFQQPLKT